MPPTVDNLRRYALARSLFKPTTLGRAIAKLGFVQADPLRAPARAQDPTLRHRVSGYRTGDLERRYSKLPIDEDFFRLESTSALSRTSVRSPPGTTIGPGSAGSGARSGGKLEAFQRRPR